MHFPLVRSEWSIIDNRITPFPDDPLAYNCIAWSAGIPTQWIGFVGPPYDKGDEYVDEAGDRKRPGHNNRILDVDDFDAFYDENGYKDCSEDVAEIMLYKSDSAVKSWNPKGITHAARKSSCICGAGKWIMYESKIGPWERIEHVNDQLNGLTYGAPFRYYNHK